MPTKYTVTLTSVGTSSVIVLPKPVIDGFDLQKGQKLDMIVRDDGIFIPMVEKTPEEIEEAAEKAASKYRPKIKELREAQTELDKGRERKPA